MGFDGGGVVGQLFLDPGEHMAGERLEAGLVGFELGEAGTRGGQVVLFLCGEAGVIDDGRFVDLFGADAPIDLKPGDAKVVFLDEVGAGVNRTLLNTIGDAIVRLNKERGYTFCVIEHDMDFIARLCDPVIVMAEGKVLAQGTVDQVKNDERVIEAYLGRGLKNKLKEGVA